MEKTVLQLDVRDDIDNKCDPFEKIVSSIENLQANDLFILHVPFKPIPLLSFMKDKGFMYEIDKVHDKYYKVIFTKRGVSSEGLL